MGITYYFNGRGDSIFYEYRTSPISIGLKSTYSINQSPLAPSSTNDNLVLAFQTHNSNGVLLSVQCAMNNDYLTIFLVIYFFSIFS